MRYFVVMVVLSNVAGCVSIPPEAAQSQALLVSGLESAKRRQIHFINEWAEDQSDRAVRILTGPAMDEVVLSQLGNRSALPPDEVKSLLTELAEDLTASLASIEKKRRSLVNNTESEFNKLIDLAYASQIFLQSAYEANQMTDKHATELKRAEDRLERRIINED